jgi:hypothetical protein
MRSAPAQPYAAAGGGGGGGMGGGMGDRGGGDFMFDPTMELEDPYEALAKVRREEETWRDGVWERG